MTVLSSDDIRKRLGDSVIIEPFTPENVNTSSYDVTLGEYYFIEHRPSLWQRLFGRPIYNIWDKAYVERVWGSVRLAQIAWNVLPRDVPPNNWRWIGINPYDRIILIPPKHTILAHTREFIGGRASRNTWFNPCTTMMKARSSFGRNFIEVCKCAGYGDVGYTNRWTMEITNNSRFYHIPLVVGRRIAQIVFLETGAIGADESYTTSGKYQNTKDVRQLELEWAPSMMLPRLDKDRDIRA